MGKKVGADYSKTTTQSFAAQPEVVVIEGEVEKLMWIALAYLNEARGRLQFSASILQAICTEGNFDKLF